MKCIKKIQAAAVAGALIVTTLFSGCSTLFNRYRRAPELPDNARSFEMYENDSCDLMSIDVNGKTYMPFGTLKGRLGIDSLRDCLGYVDDDTNTRVYSLCEDPNDEYIVMINTQGVMEQPQFWRSFSTYGEDIFTPEYIQSLHYEEWGISLCHYEMQKFVIAVIQNADDVKELSMDFTINGETYGSAGVRNADYSEMKDPIYNLEITELFFYDKYDLDEPFDVEVRFTVTTMDDQQFELENVYTGTVLISDHETLKLKGNAKDGFTIE